MLAIFLRRQGATGDEIVEALVANSATFENKTLFSQVCYRMKLSKVFILKISLFQFVCRRNIGLRSRRNMHPKYF
jgi:tRNA (adenine-N(1)-)-methyltransferase non-catalytic subunit